VNGSEQSESMLEVDAGLIYERKRAEVKMTRLGGVEGGLILCKLHPLPFYYSCVRSFAYSIHSESFSCIPIALVQHDVE
jgi:hypothetical protein